MALDPTLFLRSPNRRQALPSADPVTERNLLALWDKYAGELEELSLHLASCFRSMQERGFGAGFGDLEGELLYILVREQQPELVYEISPNSGYSTNYLLAAVTRNGHGRVESFELIEAFEGKPTAEVIRSNMIALCDPARHRLHIGDARVEALKRLEAGTPDFALLDSCHDDFFAEFYVKALLPRLTGTVVIQDMLHFGGRPEWATEAQYILSWLCEAERPFMPFAAYEDVLTASVVRSRLTPRRTVRSNSIVLALGESPANVDKAMAGRLLALIEAEGRGAPPELDPCFPLNSTLRNPGLRRAFHDRTALEDRYVAAVYGGDLNEDSPGFCDIMALVLTKRSASPRMLESLKRDFDRFHLFLQLTVLELIVLAEGETDDGRAFFHRIDPSPMAGTEPARRMAFLAYRLGLRDEARHWIRMTRRAATDISQVVAFRCLLNCVHLAEAMGEPVLAEGILDDVLGIRTERARRMGTASVAKIDREVAAVCQRFPRLKRVVGVD